MSQKTVLIVTHSYLEPHGEGLQIGGVQTYVDALRAVLARHPVEPRHPSAGGGRFREAAFRPTPG